MVTVTLLTRAREFVAEVDVPDFRPPMDVLHWGMRCFIYDEITAGGRLIYREASSWVVVDEMLQLTRR